MKPIHSRKKKPANPWHAPAAVLFSIVLVSLGTPVVLAQQAPPPQQATQPATQAQSQTMTTTEAAPKIPNDQLDSLVAPIALYPDPLLAQILAASTYPLEVIQLEQWMKRNPNLKDNALADAVAKQPWDPSVQSMAVFPDVVTRLSENVAWTTDLGNAFLAQQQDVMDAVQRMRSKAQSKGALKTSEQQKVETETVEGGNQVIVIEPANPQYVYVPSYDPAVVYGPPVYPYPPYSYPGYVPGMGLAFGTGLVLGAAWANNWGNCNWGHGDITINNNNNFNRNNVNNINRGQGGNWQHNAQHRGGAPYGDRNTANKYGGRARQQPAGGAGANRPGSGLAGGGNIGGANRPGGGTGAGNIGAGNRPGGGAGNIGPRPPGGGAGSGIGTGAGAGNRPGGGAAAGGARPGGGVSTMPANRGGGGNNIGNRSVSSGSGFGSSGSAFGGGGYGGGSTRAASSRGGSSMGGGGFSHGGGGGGGRGGGGGGGRRR